MKILCQQTQRNKSTLFLITKLQINIKIIETEK